MNVVGTDAGLLVEVQGTAEGATFPRSTLDAMLDSAMTGIDTLSRLQREVLTQPYPKELPTPKDSRR
jgi:ribonuclease PH